MSKESPMHASTEHALIEKSVREMQSTSSMVHGTTLDPGGARPHVVRSQPSVSDVKTACERRKRMNCRKALVKLDELVMLMTIGKPEHQPCADVAMLDLVDRSDEIVVGMIDSCQSSYCASRSKGDGATIREEQQTSAEIAEGELVNAACVASVRSTGKVMEQREDKARWFRIKRGVELAKCGFSKDCDRCRVAASGDEVSRPHGKECLERIRVSVMCDDAGQQRLRTAEERLAPAASVARAVVALEGQVSLARVELAQESRDEEMSEACVTNNAENVKPRVEILREDSTEAISRMEDGNTPVGGPLVSGEVNSRSEGVLPSRKRESEKRGAPGDLTLDCTDGSEMCISEMTVVLMSLGVTTANSKVAELFCRNRFGDSAVGIGFERGIVADCATDGMRGNVGQQRLHATEQRVSSAETQLSVATRVAAARRATSAWLRAVRRKRLLRATRTWSRRTRWVERN